MAKHSPPYHNKKKRLGASPEQVSESAMGESGLVVRNFGQTLEIEDDTGKLHRCSARKKIVALVCGDKVVWQATSAAEGVVLALQPRQTLLIRPDSRGELKPVAANVSQLLVVTAPRTSARADPAAEEDDMLDTALIDRYLIAAELSRLRAVIVINKVDLLTQEARNRAARLMAIYQTIGYRVLFTCATQNQGIAELVTILQDHTSVFCGPSGVGKSSLVQSLLPDQEIRIGELSSATGAGRHTTTLATLYHLPHGGNLIDSPGVRDFGLWHADPAEIAQGFVEFQPYTQSCRFANCSHLTEPGCAVQQAIETGGISAMRLNSYRRIIESLQG